MERLSGCKEIQNCGLDGCMCVCTGFDKSQNNQNKFSTRKTEKESYHVCVYVSECVHLERLEKVGPKLKNEC